MKKEQYKRYCRHLLLDELGVSGQKKLLKAKVLLVGVGGLGSSISIYLAASGVGTIGLVEFDRVDISNLQRQIIYNTVDVGLSKVRVAADKLHSINPDVNVIIYEESLQYDNVFSIFKKFDYVIDASDNFAARYLINDACITLGKTYVYGSIYRFNGQVSVFGNSQGPCYRCLFDKTVTKKNNPGPLDLGVLGVLPGVIGTIQATEIIKLICGIGSPLIGRLLIYDALTMTFREMDIIKKPDCSICNTKKKLFSEQEYLISRNNSHKVMIKKITPLETYQRHECGNVVLLDIRDKKEYNSFRLYNSINIPINELAHRFSEIKKIISKDIVVACQNGVLSKYAAKAISDVGCSNVSIIDGGVDAWVNCNLPVYSQS